MNINKHPVYGVWRGIFTRCYNKNSKDYKYYGAKGIKVCDRWSIKGGQGFKNFVDDMGPRPYGYTLDRIDRTKGYSQDNCRWATPLQQVKNRGIATSYTYKDRTLSVTEWSKITGINREVIYHRVNYLGWDIKKALETPASKVPAKRNPTIKLTYNGKTVTLSDVSKLCGVSKSTITRKLKMGWTIDQIIAEPKTPWGKLKIKK